MRGESIYGDWRTPPHVATVYGPLTYLLPGWIGRTLGIEAENLYQVGRTLSLLAVLGIAGVVYGWARRLGAERGPTLLAALATVSSPVYWTVGCELRGEPLATLCSLLAGWWFLRFDGRTRRWEAGLFIILGFLFKQSALLPLPAIVLYLWGARRRREAVLFGTATTVGLAALVIGLDAATDGLYRLNAFDALHGNRTISNLAIWPIAVLPVCLGQYLYSAFWLGSRRLSGPPGLLAGYFVISLIVPLLMTWRDGAVEYYFMESVAVAGILMALQWQHWRRQPVTEQGGRHSVIAMISWLPFVTALGTALQLEPNAWQRFHQAVNTRSLAAAERAEHRRLTAEFRVLPGPVLSQVDDLTIHDERSPVILDTWLFSGLIDQGAFDDAEIRTRLETGAFRSVILRLPIGSVKRYGSTTYVPRAWLQVIKRRYRLAGRLGEFYVYEPISP